jgi:hypothetical protein
MMQEAVTHKAWPTLIAFDDVAAANVANSGIASALITWFCKQRPQSDLWRKGGSKRSQAMMHLNFIKDGWSFAR